MIGISTTTHATIANGGTVSNEVDLRGLYLLGVQIPAAFTGATLTIQVAEKKTAEGGVYGAASFSTGTGALAPVSLTATAATAVWFNTNQLIGNCFITLTSAGAEGAARDIILYVRGE